MAESNDYQWIDHGMTGSLAGVYMLLCGGEVVYIGQSEDLIGRLSHHTRERTKVFDACRYVVLPLADLDDVEAEMIARYAPRYNTAPGVRSRRGKLLALAEDVEIGIGFLTHTDEDGIVARDLYRRVSQRSRSGTSAQLFHAVMDADPRVRYFPSEGVYRLVYPLSE